MQPVERNEILKIGEYEAIREPFRARVIAEKKARRVAFGPLATAVFENHDTVLMQIQEMIRTERITREGAILHEIETYNQLIPGERELSATVMLEIDDRDAREKFLNEAAGIHEHIGIEVDGERSPAKWDERLVIPGRASAVLYLKFPLSSESFAKIKTGKAKVALVADHPVYKARAELPQVALKSLAEDLEG
ncbi:MAG: DUF3501 family protein [Polyangiaceae bacterium]